MLNFRLLDAGLNLYVKQHGDSVAGRKIELIRRDEPASPPTSPTCRDRAHRAGPRRRAARDVAHANTLAVESVSAAAKVPLLIVNSASSQFSNAIRMRCASVLDAATDRPAGAVGDQRPHQDRVHPLSGLRTGESKPRTRSRARSRRSAARSSRRRPFPSTPRTSRPTSSASRTPNRRRSTRSSTAAVPVRCSCGPPTRPASRTPASRSSPPTT